MPAKYLQKFIQLESASGLLLLGALVIALIIANTPADYIYQHIIDTPIHIRIGAVAIEKPAILWVNDGLMAIFFMLLALEMKREVLDGELSKPSQILLPCVAAIGGIVLPALIFWYLNQHGATTKGWPIPTATDIAFALGVISLLGKRVPSSLKVFLIALSIIDDILAITIIAIFYTSKLSPTLLIIAIVLVGLLLLMNFLKVTRIMPYIIVGIIIWVLVLKSGVHATLAGVLVGLTIPMKDKDEDGHSPLRYLEHKLHPWVAYAILPLFVFVNGGVSFIGFHPSDLLQSLPLGIILGLVVGKTLGVFILSWVVIHLKLAPKPQNASWLQIFGISAVTGIGFTMSLFIASLAFTNTVHEMPAMQGILIGSFISIILSVLCFVKKNPSSKR